MSRRLMAELIDDAGHVVAAALATIWTRTTPGGLTDWGGSLDTKNAIPPIDPGSYRMRLEDGREAEIIVNHVRVHANGRGITVSGTFLGNGELPTVPVAAR